MRQIGHKPDQSTHRIQPEVKIVPLTDSDYQTMIRSDQRILEQYANWGALTASSASYKAEVGRLKGLGLARAGVCGAACPTCWREMPIIGILPGAHQCHCGNESDLQEIAEIHLGAGATARASTSDWSVI